MLHVHQFTFNPFAENTYVVYNDSRKAFVVDPGMSTHQENETFDKFLESKNLLIQSIINTHAHIDHILGVDYIKSKYNVPFYLHNEDDIVLNNVMASAMMFGINLNNVPKKDGAVKEGKNIMLGDETIEILFTPGHSPGSVSFYCPEDRWVISGDVLFENSIGRTDLPGGSFEVLNESILKQLYALPDETIVFPGHGSETTIGREKKSNPFVRM